MIALIRLLLTIALVYYALKFIGKLLFPFVMKKMSDNMDHRFQQNQQKPNRPEGEVTVENKKTTSSKFSKEDGEYVDYEEIKD